MVLLFFTNLDWSTVPLQPRCAFFPNKLIKYEFLILDSMLLALLIQAVCKMHVKNNMNLVCNLALPCIEKKCKEMCISFLQYCPFAPAPLPVGSCLIKKVSCYKLLGVHLSDNLTWNEHVTHIVKKGSKRSYAIRALKKCRLTDRQLVLWASSSRILLPRVACCLS